MTTMYKAGRVVGHNSGTDSITLQGRVVVIGIYAGRRTQRKS